MTLTKQKYFKIHQVDLYVGVLAALFVAILVVFFGSQAEFFTELPYRANAESSAGFFEVGEPIIMKVKA